ncbi:pyruvate kinase [Methanolobus sp. ZRKC2]|uniref:pyruvate kinase n=1 Tax=Methanolobus sp. ZRKC2 TaxID=3125783 RepID=UPI00324DB884
MHLPENKTKIVCTIGPASSSEEVLKELIMNGMNVARLNFSHGNLEDQRAVIHRIRSLSSELDKVVTILADLPGPKMRIGKFEKEPVFLKKGNRTILTTKNVLGTESLIPVNYSRLSQSVEAGKPVYLNDGFIHLKCTNIQEEEVHCEVIVGGSLSSNKGLNIPGAKIFIDPITGRDLEIVDFALEEGLHIFGVSFVESAEDVRKLREYAASKGKDIFVISKIERENAVHNIDEIIEESDGIMIARGDLGVEIPIQNVPVVQKEIIHKANLLSKPVITATQMLESMIENVRPTRAEATDVANAIIDGTDAIMLSAETAVGKYPVETVQMMVEIAKSTEAWRSHTKEGIELMKKALRRMHPGVEDMISIQVNDALQNLPIKCVVTPTVSGKTPRNISRFRPDRWILAFSRYPETCEQLGLQYAVYPTFVREHVDDWESKVTGFLKNSGVVIKGDMIILTRGQPSGRGHAGGTNLLKFIEVE